MAHFVEHSGWMFEHTGAHDPHLFSSPDVTMPSEMTAAGPTGAIHTALQSLWAVNGAASSGHLDSALATSLHALLHPLTGAGTMPSAPSLTIAAHALTVTEGGSIPLPIGVSAHHAGDVSVAIKGLTSTETVTDGLDHKVFSGSSITLSAAEVHSGIALTSSYSGPGHPVNTLTITASDTLGVHTATSAAQTIVVTDPPAPTPSTDGSILTLTSHGSLATKDGLWTFGTGTVAGIGHTILLNGSPAGNGVGTELEVAHGGQMYAQNTTGQWYSFTNGLWHASAPPPVDSADGTSIVSSSSGASLLTDQGTWTFGTSSVAGLGNSILLNGAQVAGGVGTRLEVANGGQVYAQNATGQWYSYSSGQWHAVADATDGASMAASSGGMLITKQGMWTFAATTVAGAGNTILLNGIPAASGAVTKLEIANGGTVYAENSAGQWQTFSNGKWQSLADSADGASIASTSGALVTKDGIWNLGSPVAGGGDPVLLNGVQTGAAVTKLEVANGGTVYEQNAAGQWSSFSNGQWQSVPNSTDGASIVPSSHGTLVTKDGIWTMGASNTVLLNGVQVTGGVGTKLEVANGGVMYEQSAAGQWNSFSNGQFHPSAPPVDSADGSLIVPASGGSLLTTDGTWTFATNTVAGVGNVILLNGVQAAGNGAGTELEVANGGVMYAQNATGQWYSFTGGKWQASAGPSGSSIAPAAPAPTANSADGSVLMSSSSSTLVTTAGTWGFGSGTVSGSGNVILLNGAQAGGNGAGTELEVANGGTMYAENATGQWYTFTNGQWQASTAPSTSSGSGAGLSGSSGTSGSSSGSAAGGSGSGGPGTGAGAPPSGAGFYVSPNGSDNNAGTLASPFATLAHAQEAMENSSIKTTYVEGGMYNLSSAITLGGADSGETWQYYPANGVDTAVLNGGNSTGDGFNIAANNVTINGLKFENFTTYSISVGVNDPSATAPSCSGVVIENCDVGSMTVAPPVENLAAAAGIVNFNSTNLTIKNNYIHDLASAGIEDFAYYAGWTVNGSVISGNVVVRTCTETSDAGAIYVSMSASGDNGGHVSITDNFVSNTGAAGETSLRDVYLDDNASNVTITGNVLDPLAAGLNSTSWLGAVFVHNGNNNTVSGNIIDLGSSSLESVVAYGLDGDSLNGMANNTCTDNIIVSNFTGGENATNGVAYFEGPAPTPSSWFNIQDNLYWNYAAGGSVFANGSVAGDAHPITGVNPEITGTALIASGSSALSAMSFAAIVGNWGPTGFVVQPDGLASA